MRPAAVTKAKRAERPVLADPKAGFLIEKQINESEDRVGEPRAALSRTACVARYSSGGHTTLIKGFTSNVRKGKFDSLGDLSGQARVQDDHSGRQRWQPLLSANDGRHCLALTKNPKTQPSFDRSLER
jgi:hypothetical protein